MNHDDALSVLSVSRIPPRAQHILGSGIPIVLGTVVASYSVAHLFGPAETTFNHLITGPIGIAIATPLVLGGLWLAVRPHRVPGFQGEVSRRLASNGYGPDHELSPVPTVRIGAWCLAGAILVALITSLFVLHEVAHGVQPTDPWLLVTWGSGAGALGGFVTGLYDTHRVYEHLQTALFQRAVEEAGHVVLITNRGGTLQYVNPAFEVQTGYSREDAIGRKPSILKSGIHGPAFYEDLWKTILDGERWEADLVNRRKDGSLYHVAQTIAPITDDNDTITHFVAIESDITNRRLREQRLSVLNRILRHNLRNKMNVVSGNARLLQEGVDDDQLQSYASAIETQADALMKLSDEAKTVRHLFQRDSPANVTCDVGEVLTELAADSDAEYSDAEITVVVPDAVSVQADGRLKAAIREAIDNAAVHNDQPTPEITIDVRAPEDTDSGTWVEIVIADNGPGIPANEQETLKMDEETPLRHGTGLGLWLIKWTMASFGGEMNISENKPRGSIVTLRLPSVVEMS